MTLLLPFCYNLFMRIFILLLILLLSLPAETLKQEIARMLVVGFTGTRLDLNSSLAQMIEKYPLGGVIFFSSNMKNRKQVRTLTDQLQRLNSDRLLIGVDQEGGYVDRLGKLPDLFKTPSAADIASMDRLKAAGFYHRMAAALHELGFNLDFAPSVDLAINPKNRVIVGFQRSYGPSPGAVVANASLLIDALHSAHILTVLKHFPGHGSSAGDSHEGFTDVSQSWHSEELLPFLKLIGSGRADMVMSAHIFNRHLDPIYPATLSKKVIGLLLRKEIGFTGVVISDDLQMGAIRKNYTLDEAIVSAVNAGVDMLLFGNQIGKPYDVQMLIDRIAALVESGKISRKRIAEANRRIVKLKEKL